MAKLKNGLTPKQDDRLRRAFIELQHVRKLHERLAERYLDAIRATDEEIEEAANALADMHHEQDVDGCAGEDWDARLGEQVLWTRTDEAEERDASVVEELRVNATDEDIRASLNLSEEELADSKARIAEQIKQTKRKGGTKK